MAAASEELRLPVMEPKLVLHPHSSCAVRPQPWPAGGWILYMGDLSFSDQGSQIPDLLPTAAQDNKWLLFEATNLGLIF
jgi:hypothetical protein